MSSTVSTDNTIFFFNLAHALPNTVWYLPIIKTVISVMGSLESLPSLSAKYISPPRLFGHSVRYELLWIGQPLQIFGARSPRRGLFECFAAIFPSNLIYLSSLPTKSLEALRRDDGFAGEVVIVRLANIQYKSQAIVFIRRQYTPTSTSPLIKVLKSLIFAASSLSVACT